MSDKNCPTVFVLAPEAKDAEAFSALLRTVGLDFSVHATTGDLMARCERGQPGCVLAMAGNARSEGMQLLRALPAARIRLPVVIVTDHDDVPTAVRAMKHGAVDYVLRPVNDQSLLDSINDAITLDRERREARAQLTALEDRYEQMTDRQQEIMSMVVQGTPNREIAETLGVSRKTVEVHRAKVMRRMEAETLADLIRMAIRLGVLSGIPDGPEE